MEAGPTHIAMPSQTAESNECPICRRTFKRNEHLSRHLRTHTQERPFGCPLCEKKFTRQDTLKRHLLGHADEASSNNPKEHLTEWTDFDQFLDAQSGSIVVNPVETGNLDWSDALSTTTQPVSNEFRSPVQHSSGVPRDLTGDTVFSPASGPSSTIARQSVPLDIIGSKENNLQHFSSESFRSTSLNQPKELKLPPELFNSMVDDYARKWLREICDK